MLSIKARKIFFPLLLIGSFAGFFLVAFHLADSFFFTRPFHSGWQHPVLLVWPDHVEMRWFRDVSEVSPRPKDAAYTFNVAPEREAWVLEEVRRTPSPNKNAGWRMEVKQLGPYKATNPTGVVRRWNFRDSVGSKSRRHCAACFTRYWSGRSNCNSLYDWLFVGCAVVCGMADSETVWTRSGDGACHIATLNVRSTIIYSGRRDPSLRSGF